MLENASTEVSVSTNFLGVGVIARTPVQEGETPFRTCSQPAAGASTMDVGRFQLVTSIQPVINSGCIWA